MNWKCFVCDDDYGKKPVSADNGYATLNGRGDVHFLCPVHSKMVFELLECERLKRNAVAIELD